MRLCVSFGRFECYQYAVIDDPRWRLTVCAAAALYWELVLIRWLGSCVRIVAYHSNFVLTAAFFGPGTGALLAGRKRQGQVMLPAAVSFGVLLGVALSGFEQPQTTRRSRADRTAGSSGRRTSP